MRPRRRRGPGRARRRRTTPRRTRRSPRPTRRCPGSEPGCRSWSAMASTMPPLAVPSSFVSTRPVTPSASLNWRACASAFWPWPASSTSSTSCGALRVEPAEHALHLAELLHQVHLRVQPSRRVGDEHVRAARLRGLHGVEDHGRGIGARGLRDHRHAVALAPDLQLLDRRRAEGVACGEHDLAALVGETTRELADGRGLARAVHADDQDHERTLGRVDHERPADRRHDAEHGLAQRAEQRVEVAEFLARHLPAQAAQDLLRGLDADVGGDEPRLELVEHRVVDAAAGQQVGEVVGEPGVAAVQLRTQAGDEAALLRDRFGRGLGRRFRLEAEECHDRDRAAGP